MNLLSLLVSVVSIKLIESQISPVVHPALFEGPQNEVVPSLFYPTNRFGQRNRLRSRVFRDASQGYKNLVESPRLFRASGRFHKRVQSATTHDIQNVPLPQDSVQIVSYKYDAEKHNEKKMANSNDIVSDAEIEDHAKGIERTTMSVKLREGDERTTPMTPGATPTTTEMPEHNSINEVKDIPNDSGVNSLNGNNNANSLGQQRSKTFFQTVTASGAIPQSGSVLPPQPPVVFSPPPPISPPTFTMPSLLPPPQPQQSIQQQNLPQTQPFQQNSALGLNPISNIPHQPSNPLIPPPPPTAPQFQQPPPSAIQPSPNPALALGIPTNQGILPPPQPSQSGALVNGGDDKNLAQIGPNQNLGQGQNLGQNQGQGLPQNPDLQHQQQQQQASSNHEQLGCGWDWLTNSCKDVFVLNWCGKCHDFGNIFLHDCKCVAPLIPLPTTSRPSSPPQVPQPPHVSQLSQLSQLSQQPLQVQSVPPPPQRNPLFLWLI